MNRRPKSKLDLVLPDLTKRVTDVQHKQKQQHDPHAKLTKFSPGDKVLVRNYSGSNMWLPGKMISATGPVSYKACLDCDSKICRGHQDQLRKGCLTNEQSSETW